MDRFIRHIKRHASYIREAYYLYRSRCREYNNRKSAPPVRIYAQLNGQEIL